MAVRLGGLAPLINGGKMQIQITASRAGPGVSFQAGQVLTVGVDITKPKALRWLSGGLAVPYEDTGAESATDNPSPPEWTLRTSPEAYLKKKPNGPNAALARKVLGL